MTSGFERVLVLCAHPDDGEFGCGGPIAKFTEEGKLFYYVAFSKCEDAVFEVDPVSWTELGRS